LNISLRGAFRIALVAGIGCFALVSLGQAGDSLKLKIDNSAPITLDADGVVYNMGAGEVSFTSIDPFFCFDFSNKETQGDQFSYSVSAKDLVGNTLVSEAVDIASFAYRPSAREITIDTGGNLSCFAKTEVDSELIFALLGASPDLIFVSRFQVDEKPTGSLQVFYGTMDPDSDEFVPSSTLARTDGEVEYSIFVFNQGPDAEVAFQETLNGTGLGGRQWRCEFVASEPQSDDHPCSSAKNDWSDSELRIKTMAIPSSARVMFHVRWDDAGQPGPHKLHAGATAVGLLQNAPLGNTDTLVIEN